MGLKKRVNIIGGGLSGCFAAYFLKKDFNITLYEKKPVLGGLCRTEYSLENIPFQKGSHILSTNEKWILDIFNKAIKMEPITYSVAINPLFDFNYYNFPFNKQAVDMMPWHWKETIKMDLSKINGENAINLKETTINFFGQTIYDIFYKELFKKIFGSDASNIFDTDWARKEYKTIEPIVNYFNHPTYFPINDGYNKLFEFLTDGTEINFNSSPSIKDIPKNEIIICASRPDYFFKGNELKYTKLSFDTDTTSYSTNKPDMIFYPNFVSFISMVQFGKFFPKYNKNIIVKDYPNGEEEAYPIHDKTSINNLKKIILDNPKAYLIGRIGSFQLFTMSECIKQTAQVCAEIKHRGIK